MNCSTVEMREAIEARQKTPRQHPSGRTRQHGPTQTWDIRRRDGNAARLETLAGRRGRRAHGYDRVPHAQCRILSASARLFAPRFSLHRQDHVAGVGRCNPRSPDWAYETRRREARGRRPVDVDLSHISRGQQILVRWRSRPIFIAHRTEPIVKEL